ncbi:hypothetical protein HHX47_DHR6000770 [Lentinula edodes]|nr:hypothetical protein HHX47_DHR6000770 [Lentinula edodes]
MLARQRRAWTLEEDQQLIEAVKREDLKSHKPLNWCTISKNIPNRSNKDCRKRWISTHAGAEVKITKGAWSEEEDDQLRAGVQAFGPRWKDTLDPAIDRSKWTSEEDELLLKVVNEIGRKWARVVKQYFPGRTGLAAKNRYNCLVNPRRASLSRDIYYPVSATSSPSGEWNASSSSTTPSVSTPSPISPISPYYSGSDPISTLYTSELDLNLSTMIHDALTSASLAQLNDALFDFRTISPVQCENLLLDNFELPLQEQCSGSMLKLYGSSRCCSTARIAVVLHEKQIGYELHPLHPTNSDAQPHIVCLNGFFSISTHELFDQQDDNGIILYGCRNICQYLATRYPEQGTKLIPDSTDTQATELFGQAKYAENQSFEPCAKNALYETIMKRYVSPVCLQLFAC